MTNLNMDYLSCQEVVELVTDYLEQALLPEKRILFEEHIVDCPGCLTYIEQVKQTIVMLRNLAKQPMFPETKQELLEIFRNWKRDPSSTHPLPGDGLVS